MNYIASVVKILEVPKQSFLDKNVIITRVRAQLPQLGNTQVIHLTFWGNLARDINNYYKTNDYIMIEGYLSLRNNHKLSINSPGSKKIEITILKVYPFLLNYDY